MKQINATVLMTRNNKMLVLSEDNQYFILEGASFQGEYIQFEEGKALPMPSYLFGIAALEEDNFGKTLDFIKNKWIKQEKGQFFKILLTID